MTVSQITLDPPAAIANRAAIELTNSADIHVDQPGVDWGAAQIEPYMAAEQRWGSSVVSYRVPNRVLTVPLHLSETGRRTLQAKVGLLQREGGVIMRQAAGGAAVYADIQTATLIVPDAYGESQGFEPNATLTLETLPDLYGEPITLDPVTIPAGGTAVVLQQEAASAIILGDYPGRVTITAASDTAQNQFLWAFRSRHYDPAAPLAWSAVSTLDECGGAVEASPVVRAGGQMRIAWNGAEQTTAGGASWVPLVPGGDLPRIPPSGLENRPVELRARMDAACTITVSYQPCWIGRP
jgi:hypothetical protein